MTTTVEIPIRAWYYDDTLDLKRVRASNPHYPVLRQDPLVLELERDRYAIVTKFGAVVFWNFAEDAARRLGVELASFFDPRGEVGHIEEQLTVTVGAAQDEVLPNGVRLKLAELERIVIVSLAVAKSVALERLENQLEEVLGKLLVPVEQLRTGGRIAARSGEVVRMVGFAMAAHHAILRNLTLFDKPEETWESPDLERLYRALYEDTFDLHDRVHAIERKLEYVQDVVELLRDLIQSRRMLGLEIAIVVLILVEIIFTLTDRLEAWLR